MELEYIEHDASLLEFARMYEYNTMRLLENTLYHVHLVTWARDE